MDPTENRPVRKRAGAALMGVLLATSMLTSGYALHVARNQTVVAATPAPVTAPVTLQNRDGQQVPGFSGLVNQVKPAVVNIAATEKVKSSAMPGMPQVPPGSPLEELLRRFGGGKSPEERTVQAQGSGFIVDPAGWVVTNYHVVNDATSVTVTLEDGRIFPATVKGRDERTDLAVLKIDANETFPAIKFGDSDQSQVGDWVLAIGNPYGLGGSVTAGIVSARSRDLSAGPYDDFLQIDAPINRGNSGGPLFDLTGHVIGVNTAIFSPTGGSIGIGFAIPSQIASQITTQLIQQGKVERGWLGVEMQVLTPTLAKAIKRTDTSGALVSQVLPDSPAAQAGLKPGDVVTKLNDTPVKSPRELARAVADMKQGTKAKLELWREGKTEAASVNIAKMPEDKVAAAGPEPQSKATQQGPVGLALTELTPQVRQELGVDEKISGAVVAGIKPDSPAAEAGLEPGDVITKVAGKSTDNAAAAVSAIRESAKSEKILALQVVRGGRHLFLALDVAQT
jgi:serine protease Do